MRDVAALAGVSLKTVSRVVNAEAGVSTDVRTRVERAIGQLGYQHNLAASNLRRANARTGTVGVLLQDVSNSFSASLLRSLEDAARARDVAILASSLDEEAERERTLVGSLVRRRVDGLVLMPATHVQDYLADELRSGLPVVFVDRTPHGIDADSVTVDNRGGAVTGTAHLIDQGHRRIAYLGDLPTIETAAARLAGFRQAHAAAGLEVDPRLEVSGLRSEEAARASVTALLALDEPPTALFAARNSLAIGAVQALRAQGRTRDIALVGFDDFPLADVLDPALTVLRQNVRRIGAEVARMLFARLDGDDSPPRHVVIEPVLVVRGSGEIKP
ncbi:MAG TPA: LacI family DNA-binding transcriptional regulator [Pedococcus sp.]|jgi:LacI family transcriptional regulator|uniref:LacI family DNA-binding transcriptional regulator n=1 Tax=Pedococcus sp. TaxID=2860345 RepID=UPI002F945DAF